MFVVRTEKRKNTLSCADYGIMWRYCTLITCGSCSFAKEEPIIRLLEVGFVYFHWKIERSKNLHFIIFAFDVRIFYSCVLYSFRSACVTWMNLEFFCYACGTKPLLQLCRERYAFEWDLVFWRIFGQFVATEESSKYTCLRKICSYVPRFK